MAAADGGGVIIFGPDGYNYKVIAPMEGRKERFVSVGLRVSDLASSTACWCDVLGMAKFPQPAPSSEAGEGGAGGCAPSGLRETVGYGEEQVNELCFFRLGSHVSRLCFAHFFSVSGVIGSRPLVSRNT